MRPGLPAGSNGARPGIEASPCHCGAFSSGPNCHRYAVRSVTCLSSHNAGVALTQRSGAKPEAKAFSDFLASPEGGKIFAKWGWLEAAWK